MEPILGTFMLLVIPLLMPPTADIAGIVAARPTTGGDGTAAPTDDISHEVICLAGGGTSFFGAATAAVAGIALPPAMMSKVLTLVLPNAGVGAGAGATAGDDENALKAPSKLAAGDDSKAPN